MSPGPRQRLFFALWPGAELQQALAGLTRKMLHKQGKRVDPERIHLTLAFLGAVEPRQRCCVEAVASGISLPAFTLKLDHVGHWPRPRVFWSAPSALPEPLLHLVGQLRTGLAGCRIVPDRRPYRAHLTLARKVSTRVEKRAHEPLAWPVEEFHLVESRTLPAGAVYRIIASWPLETRG